ncbi:hypothetical protein [Nocardia abscessus]|uniref:hypothetical protein n=1 Tax=Nocardia abscessus TaxID=120957 RepID=UPI0024585CB1|nr:hypothetical protein [Nocardia abscessus]
MLDHLDSQSVDCMITSPLNALQVPRLTADDCLKVERSTVVRWEGGRSEPKPGCGPNLLMHYK